MSKKNKNTPLKNDDIIVGFDPMYLGNRTFYTEKILNYKTGSQKNLVFHTVDRFFSFLC